MKNTILLGVGLGAAVVTAAVAATLNVKPGLWEITSQGEASGMPPIPPQALAQMSPEQRAQMMAAMQSAMGRMNQPNVMRSCVTQKMLDRGLDLQHQGDNENCKQTVVGSTSHSLDLRMECTGQQKTNGTMHIDALNPQTFSGTFNMVSTDGTNTMTVKRTMQGKWLGSDCGNVKPQGE
jgi:hypothetical protein